VSKRKGANTRDDGSAVDPNAIAESALRAAYLQCAEDLRFYAEKVRAFNEMKKAVRSYLTALRGFRTSVIDAACRRGADPCRRDKSDLKIIAGVFDECAEEFKVGALDRQLCIPDRVPRAQVKDLALLDREIQRWETQLATIGDDAQLASVDLQIVLQKQQQALMMLSNASKMMHDTIMAVIRKIGG